MDEDLRAVVTGCAGFVGSAIADTLLKNGEEVIGIDEVNDYYSPGRKESNLAGLLAQTGFSFHRQSISDADLTRLFDETDVVYHQAGQPGVRSSWGSQFGEYVERNVLATQKILETVRSMNNRPKVVYASSSSVYGNSERYPTTELTLPTPRSPYGVTKLAAEHLCSLYAQNFNVDTISLRYFTVYGPRQRPDMAFTRFVTAVWNDQPIEVYGDGEQRRDYTYISDIVDANIKAYEAKSSPGTVVNIAGGSNVSINEVIKALKDISGKKTRVLYKPTVAGDVRRTSGDIQRASDILGWRPTTELSAGLATQYEWACAVACPA